MNDIIGNEIYKLASTLWPLNRSLTGDGVRKTLLEIQSHLPDLQIYEVKSGTKAFDWTVPKEWKIRAAWIITPSGEKICDFSKNNLHLVGYSIPTHKKITLSELNEHLYSLPEQPNAIPYVTSYYEERWGFCITEEQRLLLEDGDYEVYIDSELFDGSLTYGELIIKGKTKDEVFLSTYVCHPSMANNELSGPTVTTFIAKWIKELENRKYTYRIVFIPETIGSIVYLSKNITHLKKHVIAGFNVSCVGDDRAYSYIPSRRGDTLSDRVALHVLNSIDSNFIRNTWSGRGSDERQYCAPLIDLPIASIMRTDYNHYPEYHTSLDDLENVVTPRGLDGGYNALRLALELIEKNGYPLVKVLGEPCLGKRGLRSTLSTKQIDANLMSHIITWSDGTNSLIDIAEKCDISVWEIYPILEKLVEQDLIEILDAPK